MIKARIYLENYSETFPEDYFLETKLLITPNIGNFLYLSFEDEEKMINILEDIKEEYEHYYTDGELDISSVYTISHVALNTGEDFIKISLTESIGIWDL